MIKEIARRLALRSLVVALCCFSAGGVWAAALSAIALNGDGEMLRVQLETQPGVLGSVSMTHQGGEGLRIELKNVSQPELDALVKTLAARPAVVSGVQALTGLDGRSVLELSLTQPLQVLDETVVALIDGRSRWELVLGARETVRKQAPVADVRPALGSIGFAVRDDRLDIKLTGSAALVAEVSFRDSTPAMIVELPGVPRAQLERAVQDIDILPALVRRVRVDAVPGEVGKLVFELSGSADLVDVGGTAQGEAGNVQMSIVPDLAPSAEGRKDKLLQIKTITADGGVDLSFGGIADARMNTYTLDYPPRVVVDLLGMRVDQARTAASRFASEHPVVQRVAITETRLGSARLVFELVTPVGLEAKTYPQPVSGHLGGVSLGLRALPEPGTMIARRDLDLRYRHDLQDFRRPGVVIRPVQLEGPYANSTAEAQPGSRFRLLEMLDLARDADAKYRAAKADFEAISEAIPQARAGYLPVASFDYQHSAIYQNVIKSPNTAFPPDSTNYPGDTWSLTITQPLYRAQTSIRLEQAKVSVEQAQLNLVAAEQDLILRVAGSYLGMLAAADNMDLVKAEREATGKQLELARSRLQKLAGSRPLTGWTTVWLRSRRS